MTQNCQLNISPVIPRLDIKHKTGDTKLTSSINHILVDDKAKILPCNKTLSFV